MAILILGLILFLGVHSTRIVADGWRTATIARVGEKPWKAVYALLSIAGFVLIVWGYGLARQQPVLLWPQPPVAMRHVAALLTLIAFVLVVAAYVPGNQIKAKVHHPMAVGVKVWAFAHLLANGRLAAVLFFGGFLGLALLDIVVSTARGDVPSYVPKPSHDVIAVVAGVLLYAFFLLVFHPLMLNVPVV